MASAWGELGSKMACPKQAECAERHIALRICPDCGADLGFPNVRQARKGADALLARYDCAKLDNLASTAKIDEFEQAVQQLSNVVLAVRYDFLITMLNSEKLLYANYHKNVESDGRLPADPPDHARRVDADNLVFGAYMKEISICALSLNQSGAWGFGPYHLTIDIGMIGARIIFTHKNTFRYQEWFEEIALPDGHKTWREKLGFLAEWSTKAKLAVAKLASALSPQTPREEFPKLILKSDGARDSEDYIEGHVFGPFTRRAISHVRAPTDEEFRVFATTTKLRDGQRERKAIAAKVSALRTDDGLLIDYQCGD